MKPLLTILLAVVIAAICSGCVPNKSNWIEQGGEPLVPAWTNQ